MGIRVLVCEDIQDTRELFADMLRMHAYDVQVAADGQAALAAIASGEFAVAVIDIGLPDMSGFEVARMIRESEHGQTLGLIAVTGYATASDRATAKLAGFDDHLAKPIKMADLVATIEAVRRR